MKIVHLAASPFFGGPERQMLGLAQHLPRGFQSIFLSFGERGLAVPFLNKLREHGFPATALTHNTPHLLASAREVATHLRRIGADVLCCHGYKADLTGFLAARWAGVPAVAVARGWTAATAKVRLYEILDGRVLRWMDRTVCVSEAQADKVRRAGVSPERTIVIRNAIQAERFAHPDAAYRQILCDFFPLPPARIVVAAGRLSPEKGFDQLVEAAALATARDPRFGFIVFGDGPMRSALQRRIGEVGLHNRFVLAGFHHDVDQLIAHADLVVLPSFTEGLPNVALEALAAAVPVVATAVGGTPEVIEDAVSGYLVPPGDPTALAARIIDIFDDERRRLAMGIRGQQRIREQFTFQAQAVAYVTLFESLVPQTAAIACAPARSRGETLWSAS